MKTVVSLDDPDHADVPWPDGIPVPVPGDHVQMPWGDEVLSCVVSSRVFEIVTDPATGEAAVQLRIKGARGLAAS